MKRLVKFKIFEDVSDPGRTDHDVEFDDVAVEPVKTPEKPKSDEEKTNEQEYDNLYDAVVDIVDSNAESPNQKQQIIKQVQDEGINSVNVKGFSNEGDIYDFYLEYRFEIDERLDDIDFFVDAPEKYGCKSLYDYVVQGTKICVESLIKDM